MIRNQMRLEFLSCSENVGLARVAVTSFASGVDFNLSDLEEIKVAVSEAVSNAVIHGYEGRKTEIVRLSASLTDEALEIVVEDDGKGILDVEQAMLPGTGSDPERLGLGFVFMKSFMDEVEVRTEVGKGTGVKLLKSLPANGNTGKSVKN